MSKGLDWRRAKAPRKTEHHSTIWATDGLAKRARRELAKWTPNSVVWYSAHFGERVAEDETSALGQYFVETDQWDRIFDGKVDVIRGDKGSGKSAIYATVPPSFNLLQRKRLKSWKSPGINPLSLGNPALRCVGQHLRGRRDCRQIAF
jgi:hypothetical protein